MLVAASGGDDLNLLKSRTINEQCLVWREKFQNILISTVECLHNI